MLYHTAVLVMINSNKSPTRCNNFPVLLSWRLFTFNRITLQVFVTCLTCALNVHPLWFYKQQYDNRHSWNVSTQKAFSLPFAAILVICAPSGEMNNYCTPNIIKENFENFLIHRCNYILLSQVYCVWQVVKTPTIIFNNPVFVNSVSGTLPAAKCKTILPKILNACHHFHCVFSYISLLQKHNKLKPRPYKSPSENSSKDIFLGSLYSTPIRTPGIIILVLQNFSTHFPPKLERFITSWTSFSIRRW